VQAARRPRGDATTGIRGVPGWRPARSAGGRRL